MIPKNYLYIALAGMLILGLLFFAWKNFRLSVPGLQELSPLEQAYADSLSGVLGCQVRVDKDVNVVLNGDSKGRYYLVLEGSADQPCLCHRNSSELARLLRHIAEGFSPFMERRRHYDSLIILVQTIERIPGMETPVCSRSFAFSLRD